MKSHASCDLRHTDATVKIDAFRCIIALAISNKTLRLELLDADAIKSVANTAALKQGYLPEAQGATNILAWSHLCLSALRGEWTDLSHVNIQMAADCELGPNALLRRFCCSILKSHSESGLGCRSIPVRSTGVRACDQELIQAISQPCVDCGDLVPLTDDGFKYLVGLLSYLRFACVLSSACLIHP